MGGEAREEQYPTPAKHLDELLERALNPFEVPDDALAALRGSLLHRAELHGWRHRTSPPPRMRCCSYRHSFLLPDGSTAALWELCHESGEGAESTGVRYEVYCDESQLRTAEARLHGTDGAVPPPAAEPAEPAQPRTELRQVRREGYAREGSTEHARRLLRRAENPDSPGEELLDALSAARGHRIAHVPRPLHGPSACQVWCSLYEHAFLLADGSEVLLYELEHNLSHTGHLVCEVYLEEAVADRAAHRRARERGIEL